jgi:uncharacterized membrane protein
VTRKRGFGPFPDRSKWIILSDCLIIWTVPLPGVLQSKKWCWIICTVVVM